MPRHTGYLSESDDKLLQKLKEYYTKKAESYSELRKAQKKVMKRQEKGEQ